MRLATIRTATATAAVRIESDSAIETGHSCLGELLASAQWRQAAASATGKRHDLETLDYAPVVTNPEKVIAVGLNYLDHIAETGRPRPGFPTLFPKFARSLAGARDDLPLPFDDESTSTDWEAELVVVVGAPVRRARGQVAAKAIAGYSVANDLSVRDFQHHSTQFMPGKAWEGSTPVGPYLTVTEPGEPTDWAIECVVDGIVKQSSRTSELCFGPVELIEYASTFITLMPGDLLLTGTPGGVGYARRPPEFLHRGQTVVARIETLGECRNQCV